MKVMLCVISLFAGMIAGGYIQKNFDEAAQPTCSEILEEMPVDSVWEYYRHYDYQLLDRIGQQRCIEYWYYEDAAVNCDGYCDN
jgi:hypothetical protein